jgi:protein-S-isoprenylcysteine O-methyltransferase Ste14
MDGPAPLHLVLLGRRGPHHDRLSARHTGLLDRAVLTANGFACVYAWVVASASVSASPSVSDAPVCAQAALLLSLQSVRGFLHSLVLRERRVHASEFALRWLLFTPLLYIDVMHGACATRGPPTPATVLASVTYICGAALSMAVEWLRDGDLSGGARLLVGGPHSLVRHPNYTGELLCALGLAGVACRATLWDLHLLWIVAAVYFGVVHVCVPSLEGHLRHRYGANEVEAWTKRVPCAVVPWLV